MNPIELCHAAVQARDNAYAPYSGYRVGAALLCADGTIVTGCNIENASYPVSVCAERVALNNAVSSGKTKFRAIAVVGGKGPQLGAFAYPCGMCRQALAEFCSADLPIYFMNERGIIEVRTLGELLPCGFSADHLRDPRDRKGR